MGLLTSWRGRRGGRAARWFGHLGLRDDAGKIRTWPFVSCNSENIRRSTFLEPKTAENRELTLWHLVNMLVPENA